MSDRIATSAGRAGVCPFLALEGDRDHRISVPDHRHRCFAESPAATRALAHQAAYCLAPAFPACPTFIDWARREAAPAVDEPRRPAAAAPPVGAESVPRDRLVDFVPFRPDEQRRPGWSDPPPWVPERQPARPAEPPPPPLGDRPSAAIPAVPAPEPGDQPGSASRAAEDAPGGREGPRAGAAAPWSEGPAAAPGAAAQVRRTSPPVRDVPAAPGADQPPRPPGAPQGSRHDPAPAISAAPRSDAPADPGVGERPLWGDPPAAGTGLGGDPVVTPPARPERASGRRVPVGYAPVIDDRGADRGRGRAEHPDASAPAWERPRTLEDFGSLRQGPGRFQSLRRLVLIVAILAVVAFLSPFVLRMFIGGGQAAASPTPAASATPAPTPSPPPTPKPAPTPVVHVVRSGETLSRIAQQYGVTVDQILTANPAIKNPNRIRQGDQIIIPEPRPTEIVDGGAEASP